VQGKTWLLIIIVVVCAVGAVSFLVLMSLGAFFPSDGSFAFGDKVGLVEITGTMVSPTPVVDQIVGFAKDENIRAIIVRIESPGGIVAAAQEIYAELRKVRDAGKPVVASMGGVAASGGYYVACGADSIIANPGTLTGSIGVIMSFPNTEELFKRIGIGFEVIKTGEYKDTGSFARSMTQAERQLLGGLLEDVYDQFITVVSEERNIDIDEVRAFSDGRLLTGRQAYNLGLVDRLGDFRDAVLMAGELAGIRGEPTLVRPRKRAIGLWDVFERLLGVASRMTHTGVSLEYSLR
jgi:protease-4